MLLSSVNKETALGLLIGQNLGRWGKLNGMLGRRRQSHGAAARVRLAESLPVSHYHVVIYILIVMG